MTTGEGCQGECVMITVTQKLNELNELIRECGHNRHRIEFIQKDLIIELLVKLSDDKAIAAIQTVIDNNFPAPTKVETEEELKTGHNDFKKIIPIPSRIMGIDAIAYVMKGGSHEKKSVA
jgi:hypothetical protein